MSADSLISAFRFDLEDESAKTNDETADENSTNLKEEEDEIYYSDIMTKEFEMNDVRVAMIGNVGNYSLIRNILYVLSNDITADSGKSTLIGVLTSATLDDGRGGARSLVLKHRHEQENGRTSAVTVEIMGYRGEEQVIATARSHTQRWSEIMEKSDHSVTLIDLCGHEKYLKTTLFGLTGLMPDFALLVVGSNMGVQVMYTCFSYFRMNVKMDMCYQTLKCNQLFTERKFCLCFPIFCR